MLCFRPAPFIHTLLHRRYRAFGHFVQQNAVETLGFGCTTRLEKLYKYRLIGRFTKERIVVYSKSNDWQAERARERERWRHVTELTADYTMELIDRRADLPRPLPPKNPGRKMPVQLFHLFIT